MSLSFRKVFPYVLAGIGWATSWYLMARTYRVAGSGVGNDVCSAVFGRGCDETLLSPTAWQLGFPLAGWGLVYFAVVGLLLGIGRRVTDRIALLMAAGGVGASLVMTGWIAAGRVPLCPLCLVVHAANVLLLLSIWLSSGARETTSEAVPAAGAARQKWLAAVLAFLALGAMFQAAIARSGAHGRPGADHLDRESVLAAFESSPVQDLPSSPDDAVLGPPDAPVQLIVFSSFQCPGCQSFAPKAAHLAEHFGDPVAVVFKHFPLERECNPALSGDPQPRSCEAAAAAEAARLQGAFWAYHDGLFGSDLSASEDLLAALAIGSGLDLERWQADRASFGVASLIRADAELGLRLGVDATPTVFVNGRRVADLSLPALELVIGHVLEQQGQG